MASIADNLRQILSAIYGRDVRQSIHDSIESCYTDVSNAKTIADESIANSQSALESANEALVSARDALAQANEKIQELATKLAEAEAAIENANTAAEAAGIATNSASEITNKLTNLSATATTVTPETPASVEVTDTGSEINLGFKIPKGETGQTPVITAEARTGEPGTEVQIDQNGSETNPHFIFTIPRGDTGAVEGLPFSDSDPSPLAEEASPGVSEQVSRSDHVHKMPTAEELGVLPETYVPTKMTVGTVSVYPKSETDHPAILIEQSGNRCGSFRFNMSKLVDENFPTPEIVNGAQNKASTIYTSVTPPPYPVTSINGKAGDVKLLNTDIELISGTNANTVTLSNKAGFALLAKGDGRPDNTPSESSGWDGLIIQKGKGGGIDRTGQLYFSHSYGLWCRYYSVENAKWSDWDRFYSNKYKQTLNISGAQEGHVAVFDANGDIVSSGKSFWDFTRAKMTLSGTTLTITTVS